MAEIEQLDYDELLRWRLFFAQRPPGWREDTRTHAIMQTFGCKAAGHEVFPSLRAMKEFNDKRLAAKPAGPSKNFLNKLVAVAAKNGVDWKPN